LSPLERLPLRILPGILRLSQNIKLAYTSPYQAWSFASDHIRTQLVISVFSDYKEELHGSLCWRHDIVALPKVLLYQPWLSHAFFRKCQCIYFVDRCSTSYEVFAANAISLPEQAAALAGISTEFNTFFTHGGYLTVLEYTARPGCATMPRRKHVFSSPEFEKFVMAFT
jgi:hypothetical protein